MQERSSMKGYKVIFENWEHWWGVSQLQQWRKRSVRVSSIPTEWSSRWFWSAQASCKDGRCFWHRKGMGCHLWREPTTWGFLVPKKVTGHRIFLGWLHTWEMKNFVRRWWKSHDTPEFGRSIVAGTMRHMHMVSKRKGMPIFDCYVADGAWNILY